MWGQPTTERGRMPAPPDAHARSPGRPHRGRRIDHAARSAARVLGRGVRDLHAPRLGQGDHRAPAGVRDSGRSRLGLAAPRRADPRASAARRRPRELQRHARRRRAHRAERADPGARLARVVEIGSTFLVIETPAREGPVSTLRPPTAGSGRRPRRGRRADGAAAPAAARGGAGDHQRALARRDRRRQGGHRAAASTATRRARPPVRALSTARRSPRRCSRASSSGTSAAPSRAPCSEKTGLLETADGGTLFLDEVGEMPLPAQAKLLRAIETRQIVRVGGVTPRTGRRALRRRRRTATSSSSSRRGRSARDLFFRLNGDLGRRPAAARAPRTRSSRSRAASSRSSRASLGRAAARALGRGARRAARPRVARQRARAAQRHRARRAPLRRARASARAPLARAAGDLGGGAAGARERATSVRASPARAGSMARRASPTSCRRPSASASSRRSSAARATRRARRRCSASRGASLIHRLETYGVPGRASGEPERSRSTAGGRVPRRARAART